MGTEELSLTWDDHHSTLVGVFEKLLESNTLVDCTIAAEGQYLKAHKVVLSACSPYFELLFTHENEKNPIVVLKDVKFQDLKSIIDFVYRGKVRIAEDRLEDFVAAAESLQIKGLGTGQKENALNGKEIELSAPKRGGCASSLSHKRIRKSCASNSEANTHSLSSVIDVPHETNRSKSFPQNEKSATVSISHPPVVSVSQTEISSSGFVQDVRSQEKPICVRAGPSTSYVSQVETSLPLTETQPTLESCETAVKSEPEPIAEVFLPETECFIEPKNEVCVEELEMLDNESETDIVMAGDACQQSQQNANQFSDFSTSHETADMRSNELVQMAGHSSSLGKLSTRNTSPLTVNENSPSKRFNEVEPGKLLMLIFKEHTDKEVVLDSADGPASVRELASPSPPSSPSSSPPSSPFSFPSAQVSTLASPSAQVLAPASAPASASAPAPAPVQAPAPTPPSLEGNEIVDPSDLQNNVPSASRVAQITKCIDVKGWVISNPKYPSLYHKLVSGQYTNCDRRHLIQIVVAAMCKEWGNEYPSSKYKEDVAKALVADFPLLKSIVPGRSHESFYDSKTGQGFLEYRLKTIRLHLSACNKRRNTTRTSLPIPQPKKCRKKSPEVLGELLPEKKLIELISEMKNRKASYHNKAIICELLRLTRPNRTMEMQNNKDQSVAALFNKYPHIKSFDGEMIDEEFRALYGIHNEFRARFPAYFVQRIIMHCEATAPHLLRALKDVEINLRALLLLPELLPQPNHSVSVTGQGKAQTRPYTLIGQVKSAVMPHPYLLRFIPETADLSMANVVLNTNQKQPFLVCATSGGQKNGPFFIILDSVVFPVGNNGIAAFDRLFKLHHLLGIEYAPPLMNFFNFMEACVYEGLSSPKSCCDSFLTQLALVQLRHEVVESGSDMRDSAES